MSPTDDPAARVRELTGLCAAVRERAARGHALGTTRERFARFFAEHEALFRAATRAAVAVERAAVRPAGELAELSRIVLEDDALVLDLLWGGLEDGLSYAGTEDAWFYGGQPWCELCVVRSGLESLEALAGHRDPALGADARDLMEHWAVEMYRPVVAPDAVHASHWWWRGPHPDPRDGA